MERTPQLFQPIITCLKLTVETLEQGVNFEHISHLVLVFLLLTLSKLIPAGLVSDDKQMLQFGNLFLAELILKRGIITFLD